MLIAGVFILASAGQAIAVTVGGSLRSRLKVKPAQRFDSALGAVAVVVSASILVWFIAGALRGGASAPIAKAIGESRVLRTIDAVVPPETSRLFAGFREVLDREGFPRVFDGLEAERIVPVAPPDDSVALSRGVRDAASSIIKITGIATSCNRGQEGSGWVVSRERVVTNAHVVAGMERATVRIHGTGRSYTGRVVVFDARRDLAVLSVPGLPAEPLPQGPDLVARRQRDRRRLPARRALPARRRPRPRGRRRARLRHLRSGRHHAVRSTRSTPRSAPATPVVRCCPPTAGSSASSSPSPSTTTAPATP